ncbi:hypothetical protein DI487_00465 [Flavobacterium sediminis]|uniref:Secretion system C-terminal sorting domain-containing protein n=1 Tax=Flavobacterium sediminis TaxID=2201181 RepID=A0A2U8QQY3_9FLAO|nr:hypothetical protein DI487_00465 [Flavobacterium sediminis]
MPQISGSDTNTLSLNNIPSSFSGNYFRVLISNTNDNIYSKVAQLSQTLSNSNFSLDFADAFYDRNGSIIIEKNATAGDIKFRLIDINGRVLKSSQFSNDKFIVSVGSLDNGVYFLELKSEDKSGIKKLLID